MQWRVRRYKDSTQQELLATFESNNTDPQVVMDVAYELQFRRQVSGPEKAKVLETLHELLSSPAPPRPEINFGTHVLATRKRLKIESGKEWREIGVLAASGYRVGVKDGVTEAVRRKLLNHIFLDDDLSDVEDLVYAQEWGDRKTGPRLKKIADSLATFAKNAKRNSYVNYDVAISEWEADLKYLKKTFYDNWGGFPWPDVET